MGATLSTQSSGVLLPLKAIAGLNALVYAVHAAPLLSDRYFDFTGSCSFLLAAALGRWALARRGAGDKGEDGGQSSTRANLASGALMMWCARLGFFLLSRVFRDGKDRRQDSMKASRLMFAIPWVIQVVWCSLVGLPTYLTNAYATHHALDAVDFGSLALWAAGFALEAVADNQKQRFAEARLRDTHGFISSGVWAWSRHPNYVGEILLWLGLAGFGYNSTRRSPWCSASLAAFVSPAFTYLLLNYGTGVPLLEARAKKKWGGRADYASYVNSTPVLCPGYVTAMVSVAAVSAAIYVRSNARGHRSSEEE